MESTASRDYAGIAAASRGLNPFRLLLLAFRQPLSRINLPNVQPIARMTMTRHRETLPVNYFEVDDWGVSAFGKFVGLFTYSR